MEIRFERRAASAALIPMLLACAVGFGGRATAGDTEKVGVALCALITQDEAAKRVGKPVGAGQVAGPLGTACQWTATDDEGYLQVQAVPVDYWSAPSLAAGYRALPGIGQAAYVVPEMGGWAGGAKSAKEMVAVSLTGPAASAEAVADLLKAVVERRK
jgi:hypothetical protein